MIKDHALTDLFDALLSDRLQNMYTAIPCIVVQVENELRDQRIVVQPTINKKYKSGKVTEQPVILDVPVIFPGSNTSMFSFPINKGDTVICIFSQRGLDVFKTSNGYPTTPVDFRKFDKRDAVAIPGLFPFPQARNNPSRRTYEHSTRDAVITHNIGTPEECEVRLKFNGNIQIRTSKNIQVDCKDAVINSETSTVNADTATVNAETTINGDTTINGNLSVDGNVDISGTSTAADHISDGVSGATHVHGGVLSGGASTSPPTPSA